MKKHIRRYVALAVVLVTVLAVTAVLLITRPWQEETAEEPPEPEVTIELVYAFQNARWNSCVEDIVARFQEANPGVRVTYQLRYEDRVYDETLSRLAARDELGDVIQLKEPYAYASAGLIAPLPDTVSTITDARCVVGGETYAVAALDAISGVIYDQAIFQKCGLTPPQTYQEFLDLCAGLKRGGYTPLGFGGKDLWHMEYWMNHFLRADVLCAAPDFLAQCRRGERDWNDPLVTKMLTHLAQLFQRGYVDETWATTPDAAMSYRMATDEVAMVFSGPWLMADIRELDPDAQLGWFFVPNEAGTVVAGHSVDVYWAVTAGCAHDPERYAAAVAFLEFFYSDPAYLELCADMSAASVRVSDRDTPAGSLHIPAVAAALEEADVHFSAYIGDENTPAGFEARLLELLHALCAGNSTVRETQARAAEAWALCAEQEAAYEW